ncbi:hypothetical protein LOY38_01175 [Pseudomonas sp. B21-015]|uniref:hypothetical protein n=1 Tax=Pseudomonas sp. B21-015 TaxID=2895473 RepID=UPI002160A803|nr:hypothetical protein [Pseudomonas sp. B21-015]UVM50714.1 hypothetical protein LOY38_01175 [Pseudomonas sp. B21-015]
MTSIKEHVSLQSFQFNQEVFDKRLKNAIFSFKSSAAALETIHEPVSLAIPKVMEMATKGRKLSQFRTPQNLNGYLLVCFEKENLEEELQRIEQEVKAQYELELEADKERNIQLLAQQLFDQKKAKEAKALQVKEEKEMAAALAEAQEVFQNLKAS